MTNQTTRVFRARTKRVSSRRRSAVTLSVLCLNTFSMVACSSSDASRAAGSLKRQSSSENNAGTVRLGTPYLSGTCTAEATATLIDSTERYITVTFSNQAYGGDRDSPDYIKERIEGRLIGEAKATTPKCVLHVPMQVTAGYRFSPTNVIVRGFAYRGFIFGAYRWANANGQNDPNDGYTFERQVPLDDPTGQGDNFTYVEPLHNLWSPTCNTAGGPDVSAELIVTLQPYTAAGIDNPIVAVDSFDVAGFGSLEKCGSPTPWDRVAQEGEECGIVDLDHVHPVRCDTSKQTNICVYPLTNRDTGTCVNASKRPDPSELAVGYDEDCGGPFFKYCARDQPLVCQFVSGDARQNASSHFGRCKDTLPMGAACVRELYGACDGYSCNTLADPCQPGSKCINGTCTAQ